MQIVIRNQGEKPAAFYYENRAASIDVDPGHGLSIDSETGSFEVIGPEEAEPV